MLHTVTFQSELKSKFKSVVFCCCCCNCFLFLVFCYFLFVFFVFSLQAVSNIIGVLVRGAKYPRIFEGYQIS